MHDMLGRLELLERKVREIAQKVEYLRKENIMLIEENVRLKGKVEELKIGELKKRKNVLPEDTPVQAEKLRREIDKYIVEIDKCIEWINDL
jgi:predicted nuclease with TOPRIM domain